MKKNIFSSILNLLILSKGGALSMESSQLDVAFRVTEDTISSSNDIKYDLGCDLESDVQLE